VASSWLGIGAYVIAEAGLNHNGELDLALALVDLAAEAGADAVKFQKRDVETLAIESELDRKDSRFPGLGSTYREIRLKHEFSLQEFQQIKERALGRGIEFFVTPFDIPSLNFLEKLGCEKYKIASHSVTNLPLLNEIALTQKPVLLSTGMATMEEVDSAVTILMAGSDDLAVMHCVSSYPTKVKELRFDLIGEYKSRFGVPVGYSGHELGFVPTLVAVSAGATIIERHVTLDTKLEGFDHHLSLNPIEFSEMVHWIRSIPTMYGSGGKEITESERVTRNKYQVSAVSDSPINKGQVLDISSVSFRNPGTGLTPAEFEALVGAVAIEDIPQGVLLSREMFGEH